jgi:hypothetical protein
MRALVLQVLTVQLIVRLAFRAVRGDPGKRDRTSKPASTFSRPTSVATLQIRSDTSSGCFYEVGSGINHSWN